MVLDYTGDIEGEDPNMRIDETLGLEDSPNGYKSRTSKVMIRQMQETGNQNSENRQTFKGYQME